MAVGWLRLILMLLVARVGGEGEDVQSTTNSTAEPPAEEPQEQPRPPGNHNEDIDVLCSKMIPDTEERQWTWLDVNDLNVRGHWREFGVCIDKYGVSRFRFRAFQLDQPDNYDAIEKRCKTLGFEYAQPARLDPLYASTAFGWPDRGYHGIHGPIPYQLGAGRAGGGARARFDALVNDGWFVFLLEDQIFSGGFLSVEPCNRLQTVYGYFELKDVPCRAYRKCGQVSVDDDDYD